MKRRNLITCLALSLLLLGGCSAEGDPEGVDPELAQDIVSLENLTEFKAKANISETKLSAHVNAGMFVLPGIEGYKGTMISRVKGADAEVRSSDATMFRYYEFKLSECLPIMGITLEQAREYISTYSNYFAEYELNEEKDLFWFTMSDMDGDNEEIEYYHSPSNGEQAYYATFVNGKMVHSHYLQGAEYNQSFNLTPYLEVLKERKNDVVKGEDGVYTANLSNNPLRLGESDITELKFSSKDGKYYFTVSGVFSDVYNFHGDYEIYDIGNAETNIPSYTIDCKFNHKVKRYGWYNDEGHVLYCANCGKILSTEVKPHNVDPDHGICFTCNDEWNRTTQYFSDEFKASNGAYLASIRTTQTGEWIWGSIENGGETCDMNHHTDLLDGTETVWTSLFYWADQQKLIIMESLASEELDTACINVNRFKISFFSNLTITLTQEQKDMIAANPDLKDFIYFTAFGSPKSMQEIYNAHPGYTTHEAYAFHMYHEYEYYSVPTEVIHDDAHCWTGQYWNCTKCGQCASWNGEYNHTREVTIVEPTWKEEDRVYVTLGPCSHCSDPAPDYIYMISLFDQYHDEGVYTPEYNQSGEVVGYDYIKIPHIDKNTDGHCDICNKDLSA